MRERLQRTLPDLWEDVVTPPLFEAHVNLTTEAKKDPCPAGCGRSFHGLPKERYGVTPACDPFGMKEVAKDGQE